MSEFRCLENWELRIIEKLNNDKTYIVTDKRRKKRAFK